MIKIEPDDVRFDDTGLVPVVIQDDANGDVLMLAYMNAEALKRTVTEGRVTFWSRSRQSYWRKGDTSGHIQLVKSVFVDCGADSVLIRVDQVGAACHTGSRSCFETHSVGTVVGERGEQ